MILLTAVVTYLMRGTLFTMNIWGDHIDSLSIGTLATLLFSNLSLLLQDVLWWFGINYDTGSLFYTPEILSLPADIRSIEYILIPPAWSVSLEITFYLIAPFLAKRKSYILWLLIAASFALRFGLPAMGLAYDPWVYRFFPSNLAFFLLGIMGYRYYPYIARWYDGSPKKEWLVRAIYLLNIVLIFTYSFLPQMSYTPYLFLAVVCVSIPFIFLLSKHWTRDRYIGELSYPIYIVHLFVLMVVKHWVSALGLGKDWQGEVCLLVTLILSVLMNELLLKRIDKYRQSRVKAVA